MNRIHQKHLCLAIPLAFLLLFFIPLSVYSHGIKIAARVDNGNLVVESSLAGHRLVPGSSVAVKNAQTKNTIISGKVDKQGAYKIELSSNLLNNPTDLLITVSDTFGHHAKTVIKQGTYSSQQSKPQDELLDHHSHPALHPSTDQAIEQYSKEELKQMIAAVLEQKLSPLRGQIAELGKDKNSFQDIIGGIGYLVGLAGLGAWMKSRK